MLHLPPLVCGKDHARAGGASRPQWASFSERHGLKVWLCHQHHNEPGMSPHYNATCAQTLKAVAQAKYEEKNGPGAHAAWMAAVGKDYING